MAIFGIKKIFVTAVTDVSSTDLEGLGTIRFEGNKVYKWVKLQNTTATVAAVAGDVCSYGVDAGYTNNLVVTDVSDAASATVPVCAGMILATVAGVLLTAYYLWIQIKGPAVVNQTIGGTPVDGDMLTASTTDKTLAKLVYVTANPAVAAVGLDVSAKIVALDCL